MKESTCLGSGPAARYTPAVCGTGAASAAGVAAVASVKADMLKPITNRLEHLRKSLRAEPFQCCDGFFFNRGNGSDAGSDRFAFDNHGTRPALTQATTKTGSVKIEVVAQNEEQRRRSVGNIHRHGPTVYLQVDDTHLI